VESGRAVMALLDSRLRPRDIVTRRALENAAVIVGATGGSTNAGLHLPAIAHEAGIRFTMDDVVEIMRRTPYIADLKPGGKYVAFDVHKIGGIPVVLKALLDAGLLHGDCITVTGRTLAENLKDVVFPTDQDVVYPVSNALSPTGGVVGLKGNLAPDGAIVKVAGMSKLRFEGTALCFDSEEEAQIAIICGIAEAAECQREIGLAVFHRVEEVLRQRRIIFLFSEQAELAAQASNVRGLILRSKCGECFLGRSHRCLFASFFLLKEWQQ